jgi:TonB family protein
MTSSGPPRVDRRNRVGGASTAARVFALAALLPGILAAPGVRAQETSSRPREVLAGPDVSNRFAPSVTADGRDLSDATYLNGVRDALARRWYNGTTTASAPVVQFDIAADGRASGVILERTSGNYEVDRAALAAVQRSSPFDPLPRDIARGQLRFHVLFSPFRSADGVHEAIWTARRTEAVLRLTGLRGRTDTTGAIRLLQELGEDGDAMALTDLGYAYARGTGVTPDPRRAADYYRRAGELGSGLAQLQLAEMLERGDGVERDLDQAFALYRAASGSTHTRVAKDAKDALVRLAAPR